MAAQPWRALLAAALESNAHLKHSSYFQLATVSLNGRPANRTVVFRGFQEGSDSILINTDSRTSKIEEINHFPYGEICWYFTESWEQFRINGRIDVVDCYTRDLAKLQQREESWFASSLQSRLQYLRPEPRLPVLEEPNKDHQLDPSRGPVDSFCLLVFDPEQVSYFTKLGMPTTPRKVCVGGVKHHDRMLKFYLAKKYLFESELIQNLMTFRHHPHKGVALSDCACLPH